MSINQEEQDIVTGLEAGEWQSVKNVTEEINRYRTLAANQLGKPVEIVLSNIDYKRLADLADVAGKSTESLTHEILLKFLDGELIDKAV